MSSQRARSATKYLNGTFLLFVVPVLMATQPVVVANSPQDATRTIVSDDFTRNRPRPRVAKSPGELGKVPYGIPSRARRTYRLASPPLIRPGAKSSFPTTLQLGLTVWKLRPARVADFRVGRSITEDGHQQSKWIAERVEADTQFHEGDVLRLSIESPRAGYLYVIDRDWFTDGKSGDTNLIFPARGDDNRLQAGRLIDIPAENQAPFKASPKPNQAGELLTIIVTSAPLGLPISDKPLRLSNAQVMEWEGIWGGVTERFELDGGAGQARTKLEVQAAARKGTRQLTRDDPGPQTIYLLTPKSSDAVLLNVKLSYVR